MSQIIKFLSFAFVFAPALAGEAVYDDHHHHARLGYISKSYSPALLAKSPVLVSKGAAAIAAVPAYSQVHAPLAAYTHAHGHNYGLSHHHHAHAPVAYVSGGVGLPAAYAAYSVPTAEHVALLSTAGKPKTYEKSIPAAAIRNIETVMVTKTITPVVTKTTTHHTRAEPALSLGHVQGYSQNAVGHPKIAPVQFNTQYTTYANPTVGVNGPVVYAGPAVGLASGAVVTKAASVAAVAPQPVLKTAIAAAPELYEVGSGNTLSLGYYGFDDDVHSVPAVNFLDLRSGKAVLASPSVSYGIKK